MVSKRGDTSLEFIIIAILAVIALIVIALFFTGGMTKLFGSQQEVTKISLDPQIKALAETTCNLHCTNRDENAYNNPGFSKALTDAGYTGCEQLLGKPFSACQVQQTCQKVDALAAVSCTATTEAACNSVQGCVWK